MIKIERWPIPRSIAKSRRQDKWKHPDVTATLWRMQKEKCCYCEIKIPEKGHAKAVEHYKPRALFGAAKNEWNNFLLACSQCNGAKSDQFPVQLTEDKNGAKIIYLKNAESGEEINPLLIDPSDGSTDPEEHIAFGVDERETISIYGLPMARNGSRKGRVTIEVVDLHSTHNLRLHREFLRETLTPSYDCLMDAIIYGRPVKFEMYKDKFAEYMSSNNKFSALSREFARVRKLGQWIDIPCGV